MWDLKSFGCSDASRLVLEENILNAPSPTDFSYAAELLPGLGWALGAALFVGLLIYGIVRAIGWVIGGFTAS